MSGSMGKSEKKSSQKQNVWGEQTPYLKDLYSQAQTLTNQQAPQYYSGNLVAGMTPEQQTGRQMATGFAQGGAQDVYNQASGAWGDALTADPTGNPYFQGAVTAATRPVMQQLTEQMLPSIQSEAIGAGQMGSSRQGIAEGIAMRGAMDQIGDITSQMGNQAYMAGLDSRMNALGMAPQIQNLGFAPADAMRQIGAEEQALQQAQIDADKERYMYNQQSPYTQLQQYAQVLGRPTVLGSSSSSGQSFNLGFGGK